MSRKLLAAFGASCSAIAILIAPTASAQDTAGGADFSYTFLEASFLHRMDGLDTQLIDGGLPSNVLAGDGNGFFLRGSVEVQEGVFVFAEYEREESDYDISAAFGGETVSGDFDVRSQSARFGLGYFWSASNNTDVYFQGGLSVAEFKAGTGTVIGETSGTSIPIDFADESQSGVSGLAEIGLRTRFSDAIEFDAAVNYQGARKLELADADSLKLSGEIGARAAVRFLATDAFSIGAEFQKGTSDRLLVSVRARF
ncbi:MAG: hypothetical protein JJ850_15665 [Kordiimonadaceae bacterium]|nr:hypothetical protein [Kordiimonadaceae bacterium]MBO6569844.1 hypothetical protein [Kordiimonadaceae bacterium]MBO6966060.1 hypothetical protein [Kordiimonadaceae bacterium]